MGLFKWSDPAPIEKGLDTSGLDLQNFPCKLETKTVVLVIVGLLLVMLLVRSSYLKGFDCFPFVPVCQLGDPSHLLQNRLLTASLVSSRHGLSYLFVMTHIGRSPCTDQSEARAKILPE